MSGQLKVFTQDAELREGGRRGEAAEGHPRASRAAAARWSTTAPTRSSSTTCPRRWSQCETLIGILDRSEPQVEIEAKIVQTSTDTARALGVQWGVNGRMATELGNTAPVAFPAQSSVSGRTDDAQGNPTGAGAQLTCRRRSTCRPPARPRRSASRWAR